MEPTAAVCKPEEGEVFSVALNAGDGLGYGHGLAAWDVCASGSGHLDR